MKRSNKCSFDFMFNSLRNLDDRPFDQMINLQPETLNRRCSPRMYGNLLLSGNASVVLSLQTIPVHGLNQPLSYHMVSQSWLLPLYYHFL